MAKMKPIKNPNLAAMAGGIIGAVVTYGVPYIQVKTNMPIEVISSVVGGFGWWLSNKFIKSPVVPK